MSDRRPTFRLWLIPVLLGFLTVGCNKIPDHVIPPEKMADVMADLLTAETVVENNYALFPTDSARMLLKQSVLAKHGYTLQQLDTSFMWYGANLTKYSEVYENTIVILEDRLAESGNVIKKRNDNIDSVEIWNKPRFIMVRPTSPSPYLSFFFNDENGEWKKGDMFTLRAKFYNTSGNTTVSYTAEYDDGSFEILTNRFSGDGWHEVTFYTDSVRETTSLNGSMMFDLRNTTLVIDSIEMVKKPLDNISYSQRYRQRRYDFQDKRNIHAIDSIEASND